HRVPGVHPPPIVQCQTRDTMTTGLLSPARPMGERARQRVDLEDSLGRGPDEQAARRVKQRGPGPIAQAVDHRELAARDGVYDRHTTIRPPTCARGDASA